MKRPTSPEAVQKVFDCYCKKILKNEAINIQKHYQRMNDLQISFSELSPEQLAELSTYDDYSTNYDLYKVMVQNIIKSLEGTNLSRLVLISSMGIYNEIPNNIEASGNLKHNPILKSYRKAADIVENSNLPFTIIRPGWFTNGDINYEITHKGEEFGGHDVSINSIADLVLQLRLDNNLYLNESIGINTPE